VDNFCREATPLAVERDLLEVFDMLGVAVRACCVVDPIEVDWQVRRKRQPPRIGSAEGEQDSQCQSKWLMFSTVRRGGDRGTDAQVRT